MFNTRGDPAYVPHAFAMLDEALGGALTSDELATVTGLLMRVEARAFEFVANREAARSAK